jgi:hypothetical protein
VKIFLKAKLVDNIDNGTTENLEIAPIAGNEKLEEELTLRISNQSKPVEASSSNISRVEIHNLYTDIISQCRTQDYYNIVKAGLLQIQNVLQNSQFPATNKGKRRKLEKQTFYPSKK